MKTPAQPSKPLDLARTIVGERAESSRFFNDRAVAFLHGFIMHAQAVAPKSEAAE